MISSLIYLANRFVYGIIDFLNHWYIGSFLVVSDFMLNLFEQLDYVFALRVTLKNFFKPLYQDKTIIGYILGFFLRTGRVLVALVVYISVFILSIVIYVFWLSIIPYIVYKIFSYA